MIAPRWRKVLRDIGETPLRTALAVVAMAAGVFGLGTILTSYSILTRELAKTYAGTNPSSAIVSGTRAPSNAIDSEPRPLVRARVRVGDDEWAPLYLYVVRDFNDIRIDKIRRVDGAWPPRDDEVLLERTALSVARARIGDRMTMRTPDGIERTLRVAGSVHAAGQAPAWMDHVVIGFVSWNSIARVNETPQLRVVTRGARLRHPHADQMDTFLFLLGAFGALTLVLSAVLVANIIHALLAEQVRQAGVMKAIGATTRQIIALYLGQVSILAIIALALGVPLGMSAGRAYARFAATILNANIASDRVPLSIFAIVIAIGILVPLAVALGPVVRASRITIHEAFSNDVARRPFGTRRFDRWLARMRWLPRPLMLSLRTTFHKRGRLALTVGTLAVGGAVFISALNVAAAWSRVLDQDTNARRYDLEVRLARPYPIERVRGIATYVEAWDESVITIAGRRVTILSIPPQSKLLRLPMIRGRWIGDGDGIVINQYVPSLRIGDVFAGRKVIGIAKDVGSPMIYVPQQPSGTTRSLRVIGKQRDVERALQRAGIAVKSLQSVADRRKAIADHLIIIESALVFAAMLVVLVGGLGLMSTLTLNVVERTREIGILSAIGATPRTIASNVVFEGVLMGVLSWLVAIVIAMPATLAMDNVAGRMFHKTPLEFFMSPRAIAWWLALVLVLAALSSFYPARRSLQMAVREAPGYE